MQSASNVINWGGASPTAQAATTQNFYAAATANTPTGTAIAQIDINGLTMLSGRLSASAFASTSTQTSVTGSTSGTVKFSQPHQGSSYKKVIIYCSSLVGNASYTFPTAFINTPAILTTNGPSSSVVTSLNTSAITITGATTTGYIILEGY